MSELQQLQQKVERLENQIEVHRKTLITLKELICLLDQRAAAQTDCIRSISGTIDKVGSVMGGRVK